MGAGDSGNSSATPLCPSTKARCGRAQDAGATTEACRCPEEVQGSFQQREAIMKVYHDAGVSPFAGLTGCCQRFYRCRFSLRCFRFSETTSSFRGVTHSLWLHDISIYPLYILPLLMGRPCTCCPGSECVTLLQIRQAKMMGYMFPVMMTVVLRNMASGSICTTRRKNIAALPQHGCWRRNEQRHARGIKGEDHAACHVHWLRNATN